VPRRNFGLCGKIELTDFYIFHNRKPIQMRAFVDRQEALDWAGAKRKPLAISHLQKMGAGTSLSTLNIRVQLVGKPEHTRFSRKGRARNGAPGWVLPPGTILANKDTWSASISHSRLPTKIKDQEQPR